MVILEPIDAVAEMLEVPVLVGIARERALDVARTHLGRAVFTTTGAIVATDAGVSAFGVVAIATINAVGGGAFADLLLDRAPFILFEDFYASCAVLGGSAYWLARTVGVTGSGAAGVCAIVTVVTRVAAVTCDWNLPTVHHFGLRSE